MSDPIIPRELFDRAMQMNPEMAEAVLNPNTDFMTKLLFDARFLAKKTGKPQMHWSQGIFALKMLLMERPGLHLHQIEKELSLPHKDVEEMANYLCGMAEIKKEGEGEAAKYSLNSQNSFSRMFRP